MGYDERPSHIGAPKRLRRAEEPDLCDGRLESLARLLELRASIFGQPVHAPAQKELSVLGAALFAASAAGHSTA